MRCFVRTDCTSVILSFGQNHLFGLATLANYLQHVCFDFHAIKGIVFIIVYLLDALSANSLGSFVSPYLLTCVSPHS